MSDVTSRLNELRTGPALGLANRVLDTLEIGDRFVEVEGPAGPVLVAFNERGIVYLRPRAIVESTEEFVEDFADRYGRRVRPGLRPPPGLQSALGTGRGRRLEYDLEGVGAFTRSVLEATLTIPPGQVRPYRWVAAQLGNPKATRAVGGALNSNPVPVLIPCHRVVRADGSLGGYAYGPSMKRAFLEAEGLDTERLEEWAHRGFRFAASSSTKVFCYPTCHHARRVTRAHDVRFPSAAAAKEAGYRPCKACRPVA